MKDIKTLLSNYFEILNQKRKAKFLLCKQVKASFDKKDSINDLWKTHDISIKNFEISDKKLKKSLLSLKIDLANRIFKNCSFCERRCNIDRTKKAGNCGVKQPSISSEFLHTGEESVLIPSHTIFFSGCTFHCVFCQNWDISQDICGIFIEPEKLVNIINFRNNQGSRNVNWVGGDPTPNLLYILNVLDILKANIPQIWNSNMYCSSETMKLLNSIVDLYLTDFKYGNDDCAKRLSKVDNYFEITKRNHKIAYDSAEMIIRHLVMPNHVECCSKPIIEWVSKNLPNACVNIMAQYRPEYNACDYDDISRHISIEEYLQVKDYADKLKINQI
ncbi:radical SAM protein [Thermoplasmatales archaeon SG8-52-1]|nr:MAG: radical SAM protein [Thermoplasmatales archaeon SG8-52-1]